MIQSIHLQQAFSGLIPPILVRDISLSSPNCFIEADKDHLIFTPFENALADVEQMILVIEGMFVNFEVPVKSIVILPNEEVSIDDYAARFTSLPFVKSMQTETDADGVSRLCLSL